jgi:hypothetical protein
MAIGTRSGTRNRGFEAKPPTSASDDITESPTRRTSAAVSKMLPTIQEAKARTRRGTKNDELTPQKVETASAGGKKRRLHDTDESDEDTSNRPTVATPSRKHKTDKVASPISNNSKKIAVGVISPIKVNKMVFVGLEDMAAEAFIKVLAKKKIEARKTEMLGFSKLEVDEPKHQTAVRWKSIPESKHFFVKLPDTANFGKCSVFAVKADTKESFEERAGTFLSENMGSKTLERSMALVLHHDSDGEPKSAIVGYPMGESLHYCDTLKAETANKIVMELNGGEHPTRWDLEVPRKAPSKRMRTWDGRVKRDSAQGDTDTSSD